MPLSRGFVQQAPCKAAVPAPAWYRQDASHAALLAAPASDEQRERVDGLCSGSSRSGPTSRFSKTRRVGSIRFRADLVPRGPAAAVVLDGEQVAAVGEGAKRFPPVATVNGYAWRTAVTRMRAEFLLGLNHAVRQEAGVEAGDTVEVKLELDTAPREVDVPEALANGLAEDSAARAAIDRLAYAHRKEYAPGGSTRPSATRRANGVWPKRSSCCGKVELGPDLQGDRISRQAEAGLPSLAG